MTEYAFTVVYKLNGVQNDVNIAIDIEDFVEEDFHGGDGEELLEDLLLQLYPNAEMMWLECPAGLPQ
jgi:hypothetical protein